MKPIHILTADETAGVIANELSRVAQVATWGKTVASGSKWIIVPKAPTGPNQADGIRPEEITRVLANMRDSNNRVSSTSTFTAYRADAFAATQQKPQKPQEPPKPPTPVLTPRTAKVASYRTRAPWMTVVSCAWGDDPARIKAARDAISKWHGQTLAPNLVFVELLEEGELSRYTDVLPSEGLTYIAVPYDKHECRGIMEKEALFNIGAASAQKETSLLVFLDSDVWSHSASWWAEIAFPFFTVQSQQPLLVQGYRSFVDTGDQTHSYMSVGTQTHVTVLHEYLHPGLCWAMPMSVWQDMGGINHWCLCGNGDVCLVQELCPGAYKDIAKHVGTTKWFRDVVRTVGIPRCAIDCANVDVLHNNHGDITDRAYWEARIAIDWSGLPPQEQVSFEGGILRWKDPSNPLANLLANKHLIGRYGIAEAARQVGLERRPYKSLAVCVEERANDERRSEPHGVTGAAEDHPDRGDERLSEEVQQLHSTVRPQSQAVLHGTEAVPRCSGQSEGLQRYGWDDGRGADHPPALP